MSDFQNRDRQSRAQLLGLVNSGDIGSADALRSQLEGIHSASTAAASNYASQQQRRQLNQFGQQQQSQAWGQGLGSLANLVDRNQQTAGGWFGGGTTQGGW
jgi:hypothetical protein